MSIFSRLIRKQNFEAPATGLKSVSIRASDAKRPDFATYTSVRNTINAHIQWENMYATTIAGTLVDAQTNDIFAQGYSLQGDEDSEISSVRDYLEEVDFEKNLRAAASEGRKHAFGVAEIGTTETGKYMPVALSSINMIPKYDDKGWLTGFDQVSLDSTHKVLTNLPLNRCMCISLVPLAGDIGLSQLARCYESIKRHENIADASADMIWSHGFPAYDIEFNPADSVTPAAIPKGIEGVTADLAPGSELSTGMGTKINELNTGGIPQIENYGNWTLQEVAVHFGVPRAMLGLVDNSEATANVTSRMYYNRIASEQSYIEREVQHVFMNKYVLPSLGIKAESVKFKFNNPDPASMLDKANYVKTIMSLDPTDPYCLYDKSELAEMLGKHPKKGEYDEDPQQVIDDLVKHLQDAGIGQ